MGSRPECDSFSFSDETVLPPATTEATAAMGEGGEMMAVRADEADESPVQPIPVEHW